MATDDKDKGTERASSERVPRKLQLVNTNTRGNTQDNKKAYRTREQITEMHKSGEILLEPREERMARHIAGGMQVTAAYVLAFNIHESENRVNIHSKAHRLGKTDRMQKRVEYLRKEIEESVQGVGDWQDTAFLRQFVMTNLVSLAQSGDSSSAKIRALELLGKTDICNIFSDRKTITTIDQKSSDEVKAELIQRLSKYKAG